MAETMTSLSLRVARDRADRRMPVARGAARSAAQEAHSNQRGLASSCRKYRVRAGPARGQPDDLVKVTLSSPDIAHSFTVDAYRIAKRVGGGERSPSVQGRLARHVPRLLQSATGRAMPADARRAGRPQELASHVRANHERDHGERTELLVVQKPKNNALAAFSVVLSGSVVAYIVLLPRAGEGQPLFKGRVAVKQPLHEREGRSSARFCAPSRRIAEMNAEGFAVNCRANRSALARAVARAQARPGSTPATRRPRRGLQRHPSQILSAGEDTPRLGPAPRRNTTSRNPRVPAGSKRPLSRAMPIQIS